MRNYQPHMWLPVDQTWLCHIFRAFRKLPQCLWEPTYRNNKCRLFPMSATDHTACSQCLPLTTQLVPNVCHWPHNLFPMSATDHNLIPMSATDHTSCSQCLPLTTQFVPHVCHWPHNLFPMSATDHTTCSRCLPLTTQFDDRRVTIFSTRYVPGTIIGQGAKFLDMSHGFLQFLSCKWCNNTVFQTWPRSITSTLCVSSYSLFPAFLTYPAVSIAFTWGRKQTKFPMLCCFQFLRMSDDGPRVLILLFVAT
jgi:hypothetical protein